MIPDPQRTYLLELLAKLGSAAEGLILAGAQAVRFVVGAPRPTRDFDFVLDAAMLRNSDVSIASTLTSLGYKVVENARNFQFEKPIPGSNEIMRIEFMAPIEYADGNGIRVDVQGGIHGRACVGGLIAIEETDDYLIQGLLPNGEQAKTHVRVTRPNALVMMKLLAMDDRYRNLRGSAYADKGRNEARIHAGDIVSIMRAQADLAEFRKRFFAQFRDDGELRTRVYGIVRDYFGDEAKPGVVLYGELVIAASRDDATVRDGLRSELPQAQKLVLSLIMQE